MPSDISPEEWQELSSLFDAACALPADERGAWLADLRTRSPELHDHLVRLLEADAVVAAEGFLEASPVVRIDPEEGEPSVTEAASHPRRSIGPYALTRELGRGGMGTVWLAERADGSFKRNVALKLPHGEIRDRLLLERFHREREILAGLSHPNIARLYDAGVTPDGQPYLALEYVDGLPIGEFCDRQALGLRARIELFLQVVDAVQYAHRNLVVHRDLKPSNVLVDRDGKAMLLDFGIAKLLEPEGQPAGASEATQLGGKPMTPRYASPEQMGDGPVTTSSDVYSLGVVLFELVSGALPYRTRSGSRRDVHDAVLSGDTIPASHAAAAVESPPRGLPERKRLVRELKGDLDGILLKALERDPIRRYSSAEAFGRDLARYLRGEPVEARPNSALYRAGKFVRRHRVGAAVVAAVTLAILSSLAFAMVQMRSAQRQRDRAEHVSSFLRSLFQVSDPSEARGESVTAREILDRGVAKIDAELSDEPLVRADLLFTMGDVYRNLGLLGSAQSMLERSLELRRRLGEDDPDTLESMNTLAMTLQLRGKLEEAERLFREVLARRRRVLGNDHLDTINSMNNLGLLLLLRDQTPEAESLVREALEHNRRVLPADNIDGLGMLSNLAMLLQKEGKFLEAEQAFREVMDKARKLLGDDEPHTLTAISNYGLVLDVEGRLTEAEPHFREALERRLRVLGADHPQTILAKALLGASLREQNRLDEAAPYHREALEEARRVLGTDSPRTLDGLNQMGLLCQARGQLAEAESYFRDALERRRKKLGPDHVDTVDAMRNLGLVLEEEGRLGEAEVVDRETMEISRRTLGETHAKTLNSIANYDAVRALQGHAAEVEAELAAIVETARRTLPPTHAVIGRALYRHGQCLSMLGRYAEAERALLESWSNLTISYTAQAPAVGRCLAALYGRWGRPALAAEWSAKPATVAPAPPR